MGMFDFLFPKANTDKEEDLNSKYNLPFSFKGQRHYLSDCAIEYHSYNNYMLYINSDIYSSIAIDAATAKDILDGKDIPKIGFFRVSANEEQQLEQLRFEFKNHVKLKRLEMFKQLPANIRQEIIDNIYTYTIVNSMLNIGNIASDFKDYNKLKLLETKMGRRGEATHPYFSPEYNSLPHFFTNNFSLDDLKKAHAEAIIEEELSN